MAETKTTSKSVSTAEPDYRMSTVLGKTLLPIKLVAKEPYGIVILDEANHGMNKLFIPYHNVLCLIEGLTDDN